MARAISSSIPEWKAVEIMQFFFNNKDNRDPVIAQKFGLSVKTINQLIAREISKPGEHKNFKKFTTERTKILVFQFAFQNPDLSKSEIRSALCLPYNFPIDDEIILESKLNSEP